MKGTCLRFGVTVARVKSAEKGQHQFGAKRVAHRFRSEN